MEKVKIIAFDHQGRGIAKINNKVVFVPNTLVGEIVNIEILIDKKKYAVGLVKEIVKKSPKRVNVLCPYYNKCGGCDLLHIEYNEQLKLKEEMVKNIFDRYLKKEVKINKIVSGKQYNYRNKVTLQVNKNIGFFNKSSYDIVNIDNCLIASENINYFINSLKKMNLKDVSQVIIRCSKNTNDKMLAFKTNKNIDINLLKDNVSSLIINDKVIYGKNKIIERLKDYQFVISPNAFFQTNTDMAINLYDTVIEMANFDLNDIVLDLYCGTGTIGIYISKNVKQVLGVEINQSAINDAKENKKINNIKNISFICEDSSKVLKNIKYKPNVVIVDPPRSGLTKKLIYDLLKIKANKIIYVSCNPLTLVRDLNLLENKYDVVSVTPVDMFPNTHHVECVCLLKLR